jgi:hypothetical protein
MNTEEKIASYLALKPVEFNVVRELAIRQHTSPDETPRVDFEVTLLHRTSTQRTLRLLFYGVRDLQVRQPNLSLFQISLLEIRDVSGDQWAGVRYKVRDIEEESVSSLCADFDSHDG